MPADAAASSPSVTDLQRTIAEVTAENARLNAELLEASQQHSATSEVLEVINSSSGDQTRVFETILKKAHALCGVTRGSLQLYDGEKFHAVALHNVPDDVADRLRQGYEPGPYVPVQQLLGGAQFVHVRDLAEIDHPIARAAAKIGIGTTLYLALRKDGRLLGQIVAAREEVRDFSDKEIALLQNFAQQAVIAMENARLLGELRRREQELSVTFEHMGDGVVMFDGDLHIAAWNRNFQEILDVPDQFLAKRPSLDDYVRLLVGRGEVGRGNPDEEIVRYRGRASEQWSTERTRPDGSTIEVRNNPVPGGGAVLIYSDITERKRAEAEIRAARDAAEVALEQQTATVEILRAISESPTDVQPVLDAVVGAAVRFCGAVDALISLRDGESLIAAAHEGPVGHSPGARSVLTRENAAGRSILDGVTCHLSDVAALDRVEFASVRRMAVEYGFAAVVATPLLRDGLAIGAVTLRKLEPAPFTPPQIGLLETFAAQAVIAIENVRLFTELRETLEQQTASAEILRVISQSPTDVQPVLDAIAESAVRLCEGEICALYQFDGTLQHLAAHHRVGPEALDLLRKRYPREPDRSTMTGHAILERTIVQAADVVGDPRFPGSQNITARMGYRAGLAVPMMHDEKPIGVIFVVRRVTTPFTDKQINLLRTFAAQAVIAIENVRLFTELRDSVERLKAAQANLIQAEKMASLGQLTAGIAHEIKNPLNFVNNFAGLSGELIEELRQGIEAVLAEPDDDKRAELQDVMDLLTGNLAKIVEHGRRADGIVKSMLAHSRGGTGDWRTSDINGLVEEALNLAYHGARAKDREFNVTLERDLSPEARSIDVVPQDVTRVLLNLIGNGFYATRQRQRDNGEDGYQPTLWVSTRDIGEAVEVRVRDNGIGIAPEVRDKLFQPFFTTKPTGEGTGLGLSISYDIVTQQHGGSIEVESEVGQFAEFTVRFPRARRAASGGSGQRA